MGYGSLPVVSTADSTSGAAAGDSGTLRARLDTGAVFGTFQVIGSPTVTEVLALSGAQVIVVDAEHAAFDIGTVESLVRAGDARAASVLVRVPGIDASLSRSLDTGAAGVVIPRVESAADAAAIVRATRFPPLGARGLGPARATDFGLDLVSHRAVANDELLVVAMVETSAGLAAVEQIAAVDGIDVIMVGPADLASSLDIPSGSEEHLAAIDTIVAVALAAGRHVGIHCSDAADAALQRARGIRLLLIGTDVAMLAASAVAEMNSNPFNEERLQP